MFRASWRRRCSAVLVRGASQCACEITRQLETYSKGEVRGTIRFLWAKRLNCTDIHGEILAVYGPNAIPRPAIVKWCLQFDQGRTDVNDGPRAGDPSTSTTDDNVRAIKGMVRSNRRVTMAEQKLCSCWVPQSQTPTHKDANFIASQDVLQLYFVEGNDFLSLIITGDETWVHHFMPKTERTSMEWRYSSSPARKKLKLAPPAGKVMATVFFYCQGVVCTEFMKNDRTINADAYCGTLTSLRNAIKNKRRGNIINGIVLLHGNATPHTADTTKVLRQRFRR